MSLFLNKESKKKAKKGREPLNCAHTAYGWLPGVEFKMITNVLSPKQNKKWWRVNWQHLLNDMPNFTPKRWDIPFDSNAMQLLFLYQHTHTTDQREKAEAQIKSAIFPQTMESIWQPCLHWPHSCWLEISAVWMNASQTHHNQTYVHIF